MTKQVTLPKFSDSTSHRMRALAAILGQLGDGTVPLSIDQNMVIPWVDRRVAIGEGAA